MCNKCDNKLPKYIKGDKIPFRLKGDDRIDFNANDFTVVFSNDSTRKEIQKSSMTNVGGNEYTSLLDTTDMDSGMYDVQVSIIVNGNKHSVIKQVFQIINNL